MSRNLGLLVSAALLLFEPAAIAEERQDATPRSERPDEQIAALVDQLDDRIFANRQAASEQLEAAGVAAVAQLETAAAGGSREAASRALAIIKQHFQAGSDEIKTEARGALERLSQSSDVSAAQRARDIINPPKPVVATNRFAPPAVVPAPPPAIRNFFGGGIALNGGGFRRVSVSDTNGRKSIEIDDRERRVKIETPPAGGIDVEVTDKQNAGNPLRKIAAQDLDDLRRKDPEIARLYEQYQGRAQPINGAPPFGAPWGIPGGPAPEMADIAKLQIQSIDNMLNRYRQRVLTDPAAQRMIDSLEQTKTRLQAMVR